MITLFRSSTMYSLSDLKQCVADQIKQLPQKISSIGSVQKLLRYEFVCEDINFLTWLHNQKQAEKIYWSDRNGQHEVVGIGIADLHEGGGKINYKEVFEYLEDHLSNDNPHQRYFGGFCFDDKHKQPWSGFNSFRFVVPQFEFFRLGEEFHFAFNMKFDDVNDESIKKILKSLDNIDFSKTTTYQKVPENLSRIDLPSREEWDGIFEQGKSSHEKIVLARQSNFEFDVQIRPSALINFLKQQTQNCYHFCIQDKKSSGFLGATPERLFKTKNNEIFSEAIAGTTARGKTEAETDAFKKDLLVKQKYALEHHYVVSSIRTVFNQICENFEVDRAPRLLELPNGQHLITHFIGVLKENMTPDIILPLLHPTPAVAGVPKNDVINTIRELEPFARGWYAGPVGYVSVKETEFVVGIRSGRVTENFLSLYAGAGIVDGSVPQEEWDEIENKIDRFMKVFQK